MHQEVTTTLRAALLVVLEHFTARPPLERQARVVCRRLNRQWWDRIQVIEPVLSRTFFLSLIWQHPAVTAFASAIQVHHPDHIGLLQLKSGRGIRIDAINMLRDSVRRYWSLRRAFTHDNTALDELIGCIQSFVDGTDVEIRYLAPLLGFAHEGDGPIVLSESVQLHLLTDDEATALFEQGHMIVDRLQEPHWAIVGTFREPKVFETEYRGDASVVSDVWAAIERCILSLRILKRGQLGCNVFQMSAAHWIPCQIAEGGMGNFRFVPVGFYLLQTEEVPELQYLWRLLGECLHASLEVACGRIAMLEARQDRRDQLIDAVIGLEAILLAEPGSEKYRGEMRYRFALNYGALQANTDRLSAFKFARTLYDARSAIAHGGRDTQWRLGDATVNIEQIAEAAADTLRRVLKHFLPSGENPAYKRTDFWLEQLFDANKGTGLSSEKPE